MPRWYGIRAFGPAKEDATQMGVDLSNESMNFRGELLEHQVKPVAAALDIFFGEGLPSPRGGMICLGCGQGKTVCALHIVSRLKRPRCAH